MISNPTYTGFQLCVSDKMDASLIVAFSDLCESEFKGEANTERFLVNFKQYNQMIKRYKRMKHVQVFENDSFTIIAIDNDQIFPFGGGYNVMMGFRKVMAYRRFEASQLCPEPITEGKLYDFFPSLKVSEVKR